VASANTVIRRLEHYAGLVLAGVGLSCLLISLTQPARWVAALSLMAGGVWLQYCSILKARQQRQYEDPRPLDLEAEDTFDPTEGKPGRT
jgi:hypothetical protein